MPKITVAEIEAVMDRTRQGAVCRRCGANAWEVWYVVGEYECMGRCRRCHWEKSLYSG